MGKFQKILLVDDDETSNYIAEHIITKLAVTDELSFCKNGKEAIDFLKQEMNKPHPIYPDVIFLDIKMPVMGGFQFLEAFSELSIEAGTKEDIKIIILTSSDNPSDVEKSNAFTINGYIDKPLTKEKLKNSLTKLSD